jgi:SAM-dependent methyltransferase
MSGFSESVRKELYRRFVRRQLAKDDWDQRRYWYDDRDSRVVPCRMCPKFDPVRAICRVPFGSPVRKCVAASLESHLRTAKGLAMLELGYGRRSLARRVIEVCGGSWTGLEPGAPPMPAARLGSGGYGHAASIPFAAETFDVVFGIQSIEHWEEAHPSIPTRASYAQCLREVWRVLKPGASIYFDAPIHLHGHEMFVLGDLARIRALFEPELWSDVVFERWRYDHEPLPRYATPAKEVAAWPDALKREAARVNGDSVWLLAITAKKRMQPR